MMEMKNALIQRAKELHISQIGFAPAEFDPKLMEILKKRGKIPFENRPPEERANPLSALADAKTIVVYLCSYYTGKSGNLSRYAMGRDYHAVLGEMGLSLCELLWERGFQAKAYTDNGPLNDRYLAYSAGLGFFGKNGFLIHPKWGSYTFIGYVITDCFIEPDVPVQGECMGCGRCIAACPGKALGENFSYDSEKCASYISQKKGELSAHEQAILRASGSVWGCDLCQSVCPHNEHAALTEIPAFSEALTEVLCPEKEMSNREFQRKYKDKAFAWRGKGVVMRNLEILKKEE